MKKLTLGALTLLTATTAACGRGPSTAPVAQGLNNAGSAVMAAGSERKLTYDFNRYQRVLAPKAKPVQLPRRDNLPTSVDLREKLAPVYDQGKLGACTAFAIGKGLREALQRRNGERQESLSALFQYYNTRERLGSVGEDSGGTITDGMLAMKEHGIAPDSVWPYQIAQFTVKPPAAAFDAAKEFKISSPVEINGLSEVKKALAEGTPVAFGFMVYKSFMKIGADGMMPMPGLMDQRLGGHAVLAVGYDDEKKVLIVRNSWSAKWGDKGSFYMPYAFAQSSKAMDWWTAAK